MVFQGAEALGGEWSGGWFGGDGGLKVLEVWWCGVGKWRQSLRSWPHPLGPPPSTKCSHQPRTRTHDPEPVAERRQGLSPLVPLEAETPCCPGVSEGPPGLGVAYAGNTYRSALVILCWGDNQSPSLQSPSTAIQARSSACSGDWQWTSASS